MGVEPWLLSELETSNSANNCLFFSCRSWRVCSSIVGSHETGGRFLGIVVGFLVGIPSVGNNLYVGGFCLDFKVCW